MSDLLRRYSTPPLLRHCLCPRRVQLSLYVLMYLHIYLMISYILYHINMAGCR
jgi:hypothetical protein